MRNFINGLVAGLIVVLAGCNPVKEYNFDIYTETAAGVDFSAYQSYDWGGSAEIVYDPSGDWRVRGFDVDKEIRFLINRELRERGLSEDSVTADLYVGFAAGVDTANMEFRKDPKTDIQILQNVPKGALVIVLVDSAVNAVVWVGVAVAEVQRKPDSNLVKQRLDYIVSEILSRIPD